LLVDGIYERGISVEEVKTLDVRVKIEGGCVVDGTRHFLSGR
jgi:hypothetical protein